MNLSKNYKIHLKASSLIESVMAIAIISICVFIATLVYAKLLESDYEIAYYKAKQKVSELHYQTTTEQLFDNDEYDYESFKIKKEVEEHSNSINKVTFEIISKSKKEKIFYLVNVKSVE